MKETAEKYRSKKILWIWIIATIIAIGLIIVGVSSIDLLVKCDEQIKVNRLTTFKVSDAKIDYEVSLRKSDKTYDSIRISGYIPSSVRLNAAQIGKKTNSVALNLYTSKNLIYTGTKSTQITLYLRKKTNLKDLILNGKSINVDKTDKDVIHMHGAGSN